jgi:hypothetical protein
MKKVILNHQKLRAISRMLNTHSAAIEDQPGLVEIKTQFTQQLEETGILISTMLKPSSSIIKPRQEERQHFLSETKLVIGMGLLLATNLKSQSMTHLLNSYKYKIRSVSAFRQYEMALHIHAELQKHPAEAAAIGITEERLATFLAHINGFAEKLNLTDQHLFERRKSRAEMERLLSSNNEMLRKKIDPLVKFLQASHPALYDEYILLRGQRSYRKKKNTPALQSVEIVGTVTNAQSGHPIEHAIINLVGFDMATESDADGYYLFEGLPETSFTVSCHCPGYQLPEPVTFQAKAGENLVVDFSLTPAS